MSVERIIGIDFGTSTSLIKGKTYKDGEPLGDRVSTEYISFGGLSANSASPTLVFESDDGKFQCGYDAERANTKGTLHRNFKLDLLSADAEKRSKAEMLTELFFTYLYDAYNSQTSIFPNCDEETTYVSYPAKWPEETREFMRGAASKAGFKNVKGIDEPSAAIHTVVVQETAKLKSIGLLNGEDFNILIIDMGAGTTDLALCRYSGQNSNIEPLFTWPQDIDHSLFGGREVDDALCRYTMQVIADHGLNVAEKIERKFLKESKSWKEKNVSPLLAKGEAINYCGYLSDFFDAREEDFTFTSFGRPAFEEMLSAYLKQFPEMVDDCLGNAVQNMKLDSRQDVDIVVLTGGHSQWYFAEDMIMGKNRTYGTIDLPKVRNNRNRVIRPASPQETVGYGMAYQGLTVKPDKTGGKPETEAHKLTPLEPVIQVKGQINERALTRAIEQAETEARVMKYARVVLDPVTQVKEQINEWAKVRAMQKTETEARVMKYARALLKHVPPKYYLPFLYPFSGDPDFTKRLSEALTYAQLEEGEYPVLLYDSLNIASRFLLTTKALYICQTTPVKYTKKLLLSEIKIIGNDGKSNIIINNTHSIHITGNGKKPLKREALVFWQEFLVELLNNYFH